MRLNAGTHAAQFRNNGGFVPFTPADARSIRVPTLVMTGQHSRPGVLDVAPWAGRVRVVDAEYDGPWELPVLGAVSAPSAVAIRPDGHVAWVGEGTDAGLRDALTTWFGAPGPVRSP